VVCWAGCSPVAFVDIIQGAVFALGSMAEINLLLILPLYYGNIYSRFLVYSSSKIARMNLLELLDVLDKNLFKFIHADAAIPLLDGFFKLLREALTWVPLYAFMLYWIIRFGRSYAWPFVLLTVVTFAVTDYSSSSIFKPLFMRERPCYDAGLQDVIRGLIGCGGRNSFPSSHAANHFGLAAFWFRCIYLVQGKKWHWLWVWAFMIGYAQIYVGKHYPLDILAGAVLGYAVGMLMALIFERWQFPRKQSFEPHHKPVPGLN
jgi:membrane-associated phospholipid phosphatase